MVAPDLMIEWKRRLDDFAAKGWHNRVVVKGHVGVEYVGLTNLAGTGDDRVVVRISATLDDYVVDRAGKVVHHDGSDTTETGLREYWTLERTGDRWMLVSIEQDAEGRHNLTAPVVADPADDPAMADRELTDLAVEDRLPDGFDLPEVADVDFDGSALAAARDMSLSDERFDPGVIEAAARRAVTAWAAAVDGDDDALLQVATPGAVAGLLHPDGDDRHRLVVRGPRVESIHITRVDAAATPARVDVEVRLRGVRFVQDRDTADPVSGSDARATRFTEHWTMTLQDPGDATPWRIAGAVPIA
jgi:predicted lipid-binding transport protein (Tim44 family)